jgi:hypothetical protein
MAAPNGDPGTIVICLFQTNFRRSPDYTMTLLYKVIGKAKVILAPVLGG